MTPSNQQVEETANAIDKAYGVCNFPGCGYHYVHRGCVVDINDLRRHKASHTLDELKALFKEQL